MTQPNFPELELSKLGGLKAIASLLNQFFHPKNVSTKVILKDSCLQITLEADEIINQEESVKFIGESLTKLQLKSLKKLKICKYQIGQEFLDWYQEIELDKKANLSSSITELFNKSQPEVYRVLGHSWQKLGGVGRFIVDRTKEEKPSKDMRVSAVEEAINTALSHPIIKPHIEVAKAASQAWLLSVIEQVNLNNVETVVKKIQQNYPHEKPFDIAAHLKQDKSIRVAGAGLVVGAIPGRVAEELKVDLVIIRLLQAELIYEIAATYGFNLNKAARKNEVLAIFDQVLNTINTGKALRTGLGFLQGVPIAGAFIGAGSDVGTLHALGSTACKFYNGKVNHLSQEEALADSQEESEKSLKAAINQEGIMAQIVVHMILAGNTENSWETILPKLKELNLSLAPLDTIAASIKSPQPLNILLNQLDKEFAAQLLAECYKVSQLDSVTTSDEAMVIEKITQKFNIDLNSIRDLPSIDNVSKD